MAEDDRGARPPAQEQDLDMEQIPQGRYIPYSGGSMGWFENQGVLKSERRNNYRLHTAMESEYVRAALFQRWGQVTDQRRAQRIARENSVNVLMSDESAPETAFHLDTAEGRLSGTTKDISHYGMRMVFTESPGLSRGDKVHVQLLGATGGEVMLEVPATVVWIKREVVVRPVWFVGLAFMQITSETEAFFRDFLGD